jgi:hypothetical protein
MGETLLLTAAFQWATPYIRAAGMSLRPEIEKTGLTEISLVCWIGKSYGFASFRGTTVVFGQKIDPYMQFGYK